LLIYTAMKEKKEEVEVMFEVGREGIVCGTGGG
jgi:hypothetical protein